MDGSFPAPEGRVGPNAVIQLATALGERAGPVFEAAGHGGLIDALPEEMTDQGVVRDLYDALWRLMPEEAPAIARDAGVRTAEYIIANRIPSIARGTLRALPGRIAAPLLLRAIERSAWTFAGSGRCEISTRSLELRIHDNPIAMPGCPWHRAVFERMFRRLATPRARVTHTACCRDGHAACHFEIHLY